MSLISIYLYWAGICLCIIQSGLTSGLTLALFGFPRLRLESEASAGNSDAIKILKLRKNSHLLLATLIWANVTVNVLLAFLTDSIMNGYVAFIFTTFVITFLGEIIPQAYISRRALKVGATLIPLVKAYLFITYPLSRPTGAFLDKLIGKEDVDYLNEEVIKEMLKSHMMSSKTDVEKLEGQGALNFLTMDDMNINQEGEFIDPKSIIKKNDFNIDLETKVIDIPSSLIDILAKLDKKWAIFVNSYFMPEFVINSNLLMKKLYVKDESQTLSSVCHYPIVVSNPSEKLADSVLKFKVFPEHSEDDVIDQDVILIWTDSNRKILTGSDILGRLLRGIVQVKK